MSHARLRTASLFGAAVVLCTIIACTVTPGPGGVISFTIADQTFTLDLGVLFNVQPDTRVAQVVDGEPFTETPTDTPSSGSMRLRSTSITVLDPSAGKLNVQEQAISGSASLTVKIDQAGAAFPCDTGIEIGTFTITFENGLVTSIDQTLSLSADALALVVSNSFSMCLEMEATVQVSIEIAAVDLVFGPAVGSDNGNDNDSGGGETVGDRLTTDPASDTYPSWDPASDLIVFVTDRAPAEFPASNLGSVQADGSGEGNLATGSNEGFGIAGSPSWVGSTGLVMLVERVVFHEYMTFDTGMGPFTRSVSDGDDEALKRKLFIPGGDGGDEVTVSRDGKQVLWRHSTEGGGGTATIRSASFDSLTGQDADAFGTVHLTGEGTIYKNGIALTPDGSKMVISLDSGDGFDLFLYDITSTGVQLAQLTDTGQTLGYNNARPDVSPDGEWVAFARTEPGESADLFIIGTDGSGLSNLTESDASEGGPSWSPDGNSLAFHRWDTNLSGGIPDNWNIYTMSLDVSAGCGSDASCPSGTECVGGMCVSDPGGCNSAADCASGQTCVGGMCVSDPGGCSSAADCASGQTCTNGECVAVAEPDCSDDDDCDAGEMCFAGVCVPSPDACDSDDECLPGEVCVAGYCVPESDECSSDGECDSGETCIAGVCIPTTSECDNDTECEPDEICVEGTCVEDPGDDGYTTATIIHHGSEQIIAGPNVDPAYGTVTPAGYGIGGYKRTALSGDNSKVWFVLYDEFPNVEGDPRHQLWCVNLDGTGGQRSVVAGEDDGWGLSVETNYDGSVCYGDLRSDGKVFRATPGATATEAFDYAADGYMYGDIRGQFKISDDATAMVYRSYADTRFMSVDLTAIPNTPVVMASGSSLPVLGVNARGVFANIDMTADGSRWIGVTDHWSPDWDPTLKAGMWIGSSLAAGATPALHDHFSNLDGGEELNITDDGTTIAYCLTPDLGGFADPNRCIVEAIDGSSSTVVGDGRSWSGFLVLADGGSRVHYSTDTCCSGGTGILEDVATGEKLATGTGAFLVDYGNTHLSDDGNILVSTAGTAAQPGVYVLRDGTDPPSGFPSIDSLSYKFAITSEGCSLFVRVAASSPRGIETIFANPYFDGVDPTQAIDGDVNPMFAGRAGFFTAFAAVEGMENVWEREIQIKNDVGVCVSELLTNEYRLRVIVKDANGTMSVFQDFSPVP